MKKINQNKKDMRRIRREYSKRYKLNAGEILHTDATIPEVISIIAIVLGIIPNCFLNDAMFIGYKNNSEGG